MIIVVGVLSLDTVCFGNKNIYGVSEARSVPVLFEETGNLMLDVKPGYNQYLSENATYCTVTCDIPVSSLPKYINRVASHA
jgi:hypothetical protein